MRPHKIKLFINCRREFFRSEDAAEFLPQPPPSAASERSGQEFFSKWVRAIFRISHNSKLFNFFAGDKSECSPRRTARLASISSTKSHGSPNETETFIRV